MMPYVLIISATVLFSLQFLFNSGYERECGSGWPVARNFALITGAIGALFLLILGGFKLQFSWFSAGIALLYAIANILYTFASIKALAVANLSLYSMFAMLGGMLLPYIFGLCIGEEFKFTGVLCCVLITVALLLTVEKGQTKSGALKYYLLVFFLNGLFGVLSTLHQRSDLAVDSNSYLFLGRVATVVICAVCLLLDKNRSFRHTFKAVGYSVGYSVFSCVGNLLLLLALLNLPASVQYPIVTGGVIVLSAVVDVLRRETVTVKTWIAVGIAFAASVVIAL